jgi:hypothetical protein
VGMSDDRSAEYHVEHHEGGGRSVVAVGTPLLEPLAIRLAAQGKGGYLAVVRAETGELVIRCPLVPDDPPDTARA